MAKTGVILDHFTEVIQTRVSSELADAAYRLAAQKKITLSELIRDELVRLTKCSSRIVRTDQNSP